MALYSLNKRQARTMLGHAVLSADDYLSSLDGAPYVPTATSTTTLTFGDLVGVYGDAHWNGADVRATHTSAASVSTRRSTGFIGSTGVVTVPTTFGGTPSISADFFEMIRSPYSFAMLDSYLTRALMTAVEKKLWVDMDRVTIAVERNRMEYPLPSGFAEVQSVQADWQGQPSQGILWPEPSSSSLTEKTIQATTTQYSQGFQFAEDRIIDGFYIPMRKFGTPTSTLTIDIWANSGGVPLGTGAGSALISSATVAVATVQAMGGAVWFQLSAPYRFVHDTVYHWAIHPSAGTLSTSHYYALLGDTGFGYTYGAPAVSANTGSTFTAETGYDLGFFAHDARTDWRFLEQGEGADWYLPNGSTRSIVINPTNGLPWEPTAIRLIGQGAPATIDGASNDGTSIDINADWLVAQATSLWLFDKASGDTRALQQAIAMQQMADLKAKAIRVLTPSMRVERN